MRPSTRFAARSVGVGSAFGAAAVAAGVLRGRSLHWGATDDEVAAVLPGDDLVAPANLTATRAITVRAAVDDVWPWLVQLGQGRGGFYSYDWLENLAGCDIHSADEIVPAWQTLDAGDEVRLAAEVPLTVALLEPGRAIVLRGGIPMATVAPPYDFSWAFVLREESDGSARLVVRERYGYTRPWAALIVEPAELISGVMSQRMLCGIRERAERATGARP